MLAVALGLWKHSTLQELDSIHSSIHFLYLLIQFHVQPKLGRVGQPLTCMRFMASRIWSRWWAELRASRRMSVNFSSFSLSSFFSWSTISASASVHSHSLRFGIKQGGRTRGRVTSTVTVHQRAHAGAYKNRFTWKRQRVKEGKLESVKKTAQAVSTWRLGRLRRQLFQVQIWCLNFQKWTTVVWFLLTDWALACMVTVGVCGCRVSIINW